LDDATSLRKFIPSGVVALAAVPGRQEDGLELDDIADIGTARYDAVVLTDSADDPEEDHSYLAWVLGCVQSKKSGSYSFGTMGTMSDESGDMDLMPAAQEAKKRNPKAWYKTIQFANLDCV